MEAAPEVRSIATLPTSTREPRALLPAVSMPVSTILSRLLKSRNTPPPIRIKTITKPISTFFMVFEPQFAKKLAIFYGLGFYLVIARLNQYSLLNPGCFRENPFDVFSLIENKTSTATIIQIPHSLVYDL
jgi:hypothetical protein